MEYIKPTSDRKVRFYTTQQNSFGLLPGDPATGGTCPECTQAEGGCWYLAKGRKTRTCYVDGLMGCYKGVRAILAHNTRILKAADVEGKKRILAAEFNRFEVAEAKRAARLKTSPHMRYRLHWSGDVFDADYAEALAYAIRTHPGIEFWTYTRSWDAIPWFCDLSNLTLYLSLDPVNVRDGVYAYLLNGGPANPKLQLCYMGKTNDFHGLDAVTKTYAMFPAERQNRVRMAACPVDTGNMKLEEGCSKCRRCISPGNGAVWFKT